MVFNATVNTISVISWRLVLLVEETGEPEENHRPVHLNTVSLYCIACVPIKTTERSSRVFSILFLHDSVAIYLLIRVN